MIVDAVARTGIPRRTIIRRVDAFLRGVSSPYAIRGGRADDAYEGRYVDAVDAERVRLQTLGKLAPEIDAVAWAASPAGRKYAAQYRPATL